MSDETPITCGQPQLAVRKISLSWYVVQCKPREDDRALEHLERQGFQCFLPSFKAESPRAGRSRAVRRPLFPGYLFIHLDKNNHNWGLIRSTRGVNQLVRCGDEPARVPDAVIEQIRQRLEGAPVQPYLQPGEKVQITEGPFAQLDAIFVAKDGNERVILLLNLLQTTQQVSFPVGSVRKAG